MQDRRIDRMWRSSMRTLYACITLASLAKAIVDGAACSSSKENILTSTGCPTPCGTNPCVLYSAANAQQCQTLGSSGKCLVDTSYSDASGACDMTYQCLDNLVDDAKHKWLLALQISKQGDTATTAFVTQVKTLVVPDGVQIVQLSGGTGSTAKGVVKNVLFDDSLFTTPASVVSFFITDINVRGFFKAPQTSHSSWKSVSLINANLDTVPDALGDLNLTSLELQKNFITSLPDASSPVGKTLQKLVRLRLDDNGLTDFALSLPSIETLNLTGNPLSTIPSILFNMSTLKALSMRRCNLTNLLLTDTQFTFMEQLTSLDIDLTVTKCTAGYAPRNLTRGVGQVCMAGIIVDPMSSPSGLVIGLCVGGCVLLVCLLAFIVYRRRKQKQSVTTTTGTNLKGNRSTRYETNELTEHFLDPSDTFGSSSIWNDPDLLAVRIEYRDVERIKLLSRGGFGEVWLGAYLGEQVAIKSLLSDKKTMADALAFAAEIKIMARLEHPKIVHFIGVAWTSALTIQAITEFMDCGDLKSLLDSTRAPSLTWGNLKCQIAIDVADALVYLHTLSPKLIHRDLKSRNVLIDAHRGAKLSDFGISRNRSVDETMTAGVGTARWIAPEVVLGGHYTEFADVYSFGVVLSELDTCKTPFYDAVTTNGAKMQDVTILQLVSAGQLQPSFEASCPPSIVQLAKACLSCDPAQRPSAIHISYELRKILQDEL